VAGQNCLFHSVVLVGDSELFISLHKGRSRYLLAFTLVRTFFFDNNFGQDVVLVVRSCLSCKVVVLVMFVHCTWLL
jgi:hypothetical protein